MRPRARTGATLHEGDAHQEWPIGDYAMLGDTRIAALVASDGAIDWMCIPRFDGQPVFGRLVGGPDAGTFRMGPAVTATVTTRRYRPDTATLEITWHTPDGQLTLTEAMIADVTGRLSPSTLLVRRLAATGGAIDAVIEFDPRLGEHHVAPRCTYRNGVLVCAWSSTALALCSTPPIVLDGRKSTTVTITPNQPLTVSLTSPTGSRSSTSTLTPPTPPSRSTNRAGEPGAPTSMTTTYPIATPWSAACSPCDC